MECGLEEPSEAQGTVPSQPSSSKKGHNQLQGQMGSPVLPHAWLVPSGQSVPFRRSGNTRGGQGLNVKLQFKRGISAPCGFKAFPCVSLNINGALSQKRQREAARCLTAKSLLHPKKEPGWKECLGVAAATTMQRGRGNVLRTMSQSKVLQSEACSKGQPKASTIPAELKVC